MTTNNFVCAWDWPEVTVKIVHAISGFLDARRAFFSFLLYRIGFPKQFQDYVSVMLLYPK